MNKKTLFEITLKLVGLFALWNFLQSLGGIVTALGILTIFANTGEIQNSFMGFIAINMLLNIVIPGIISFCCLFKTQKLISILRLNDAGVDKISINPRTIYNILVLFSAVAIFMHGCANFMVYSYNRETNTETTIINGAVKDAIFVNGKETKNVNYIAFAEIIIGIIVLLKSADITNWLHQRYGGDNSKDEEPSPI